MDAILSSPLGTYKLKLTAVTKARNTDFENLFGVQNYIRGLFYFLPMNGGAPGVTKYMIAVERDHRNPVMFMYDGKNYSMRANGIVYLMVVVKNGDTFALDRMMIVKSDMPVVNQKVKVRPLPLPNIWETGFVCMGSAGQSVKTTSLGMSVDYFINQFWASVFRNDLRVTMSYGEGRCSCGCKSEKEYLAKLTRKSRSDVEFSKGSVDKFMVDHSKKEYTQPISYYIDACINNTGRR